MSSLSPQQSQQRTSVKRCMSGISGRRRRQATIVSIRKAKKEDAYAMRRNMAVMSRVNDDQQNVRVEVMENLMLKCQAWILDLQKDDVETKIKSMRGFVLLMSSGVPSLFDSSDAQYDSLWEIIERAMPFYVGFLEVNIGNTQLQADAAFCLRFIASMGRSEKVIQRGALPKLMTLLTSGVKELQLQAAWCIGNVASESPPLCAKVLKVCTLDQVLPLLHLSTSPSLRRAAVWLVRSLLDSSEELVKATGASVQSLSEISNVLSSVVIQLTSKVEARPESAFDRMVAPWRMFEIPTDKLPPNDVAIVRVVRYMNANMAEVVDVDTNYLTGENDVYQVKVDVMSPLEALDSDEMDNEAEGDMIDNMLDERALTISDSVWGLVELSSSNPMIVQAMLMHLGLCASLVKLLTVYKSPVLVSPVIRLFGNMVSGTDEQIQSAVNSGMLLAMADVLYHSSKTVREETCWTLSNVAAGPPPSVAAFFQTPHLLSRLVEQLEWAEWDVRRESAWVICNVVVRASTEQVTILLELGILNSFRDLLDQKDPQVTLLILESLESILGVGIDSEDVENVRCTFSTLVEESGCMDKIEDLCYDENEDISNAASTIMDTYFPDDEGEAAFITGSESTTDASGLSPALFSFQLPPQQAENAAFQFKS